MAADPDIAAAIEAVAAASAMCAGAQGRLVAGDTLFLEGEVTYTRHDGGQIAIPFVDVFEYEGEKIAEYKIYIDVGPLYAD